MNFPREITRSVSYYALFKGWLLLSQPLAIQPPEGLNAFLLIFCQMNSQFPSPVALAWSGGKDSMLALHALRQSGIEVAALLTTVSSGFGDLERINAHGVRRELLDAQTRALNLPVEVARMSPSPSNTDYEASFGTALQRLQTRGVTVVAAGDLFLEDVRAYREALLQKFGMTALFPLWESDTTHLAQEFIALGFEAVLSCVDTSVLDASFAGRAFDALLLRDLPEGVDPCGENGEFHTFVHNGPGFACPVALKRGEVVLRDGRFCFCDLLLG